MFFYTSGSLFLNEVGKNWIIVDFQTEIALQHLTNHIYVLTVTTSCFSCLQTDFIVLNLNFIFSIWSFPLNSPLCFMIQYRNLYCTNKILGPWDEERAGRFLLDWLSSLLYWKHNSCNWIYPVHKVSYNVFAWTIIGCWRLLLLMLKLGVVSNY